MKTQAVEALLRGRQDTAYLAFQGSLLPTVPAERMIGVRTPELKEIARQMSREADVGEFLASTPHRYFEEDQLHAFIIAGIKDFDRCLSETCRFLPFVDNWATCDQLNPRVFAKRRTALLPVIDRWLASDETYTVRFGVRMLMTHFLDDAFLPLYAGKVAAVRSEEYYVKMMVAWYFATALAKQYAAVVPMLENRALEPWTHNKAIQKAVESRRITEEQKAYLRTLKIV